MRFHETTVFDVALTEGTEALRAVVADDAAPRVRFDAAMKLAGTPAVLTDVPYLDRSVWSAQRYPQILRIDPYLAPFGPEPYAGRGSDTPRFRRVFDRVLRQELVTEGITVPATLGEYIAFATSSLSRRLDDGAVGLKIAAAYTRTLEFLPRDPVVAAEAYAALAGGATDPSLHRIVGDAMVYELSAFAAERGLPIQVHVGMGHNEPGLRLSNAHPFNLEPWLGSPELNQLPVVLIHGGYPFSSELCAMALGYGNVYLDYSWMPYLHLHHMTRMLQEWLEILPANRVMYGTDTGAAELHVSATARARTALATALGSGVAEGLWRPDAAEWLAARVLSENVRDLYRLT